jgi:hypothetical protein
VLVSISIVVVSLVAIAGLKMRDPSGPSHTGPVMTFVLVFLVSNFVLTLLMILKRIFVMLSRELDKPALRKAS